MVRSFPLAADSFNHCTRFICVDVCPVGGGNNLHRPSPEGIRNGIRTNRHFPQTTTRYDKPSFGIWFASSIDEDDPFESRSVDKPGGSGYLAHFGENAMGIGDGDTVRSLTPWFHASMTADPPIGKMSRI